MVRTKKRGGKMGRGKEKERVYQKAFLSYTKQNHTRRERERERERERVIADSSPMVQGAYAERMRLTILWLKN